MKKIFYVVFFFLLFGCDVKLDWYLNFPPRSAKDEFFIAVSSGDFEKVKKFIEEGIIGVNEIVEDVYHQRPLYIATYYGDEKIVLYLLEMGADINAKAVETAAATALHLAIGENHERIAHKLLDLGADPSIDLNSGISTCLYAKRKKMQSIVDRLPSCKTVIPSTVC